MELHGITDCGSQSMAAKINKLDGNTRSKIRSTQILTTLHQIISELIQNSLDAQAKHIDIGIDMEEWMCWVRDDGFGISKEDLLVFAGEDEHSRYNTSKEYIPINTKTTTTYGFRGEALASAGQLTCLEIASRSERSRVTWSVIVKGGRCLYEGEAVRWRRESPGTVVCIRDAFYNLPVRRLSHPSPAKTWELVRQEVEVYALVSPSVTFSLEDLHKNQIRGVKERTFRIPKTNSTLDTFRQIYGRTLVEDVESINAVQADLHLKGFISLRGSRSKAYQFLYINSHPLEVCELHKVIDAQFSSSNFGKTVSDDQEVISNASQNSDKNAIFVLNIVIPPNEVDNTLVAAKNVVELQNKSSVISFLGNAIRQFLIKHEFIFSHSNKARAPTTMPHKRRRVVQEEYGYDDLAQASHRNPTPTIWDSDLQDSYDVPLEATPFINFPGDGEDDLPNTFQNNLSFTGSSTFAPETELYCLPPRLDYDVRRTISTPLSQSRSWLDTTSVKSAPTWLRSALAANNSFSTSEPKIPSLSSSLISHPLTAEAQPRDSWINQNYAANTKLSEFCSSHSNLNSNFFKRTDLHSAKIIGQVDKKFIACLISRAGSDDYGSGEMQYRSDNSLPPSDPTTLLLIDQHAADERIRVEGFLKELCEGFLRRRDPGEDSEGVTVRILTPAKPILMTTHELQPLRESREIQEAFRKWGVRFTGYSTSGTNTDISLTDTYHNGYDQIMVEAIPEIVADKLLIGDQLQDLVRGFLSQLKKADYISFPSIEPVPIRETDSFYWLKALRWCPQQLLDLLNSKACRGAIMFNDTLNIYQCEELIRNLSRTAYPFQCAHGRPSLVPVLELDSLLGSCVSKQLNPCDWSKLHE